MHLTPRVRDEFGAPIRTRGDAYQQAGRVRIESDGETARARVRGSTGTWYRVFATGLVDRGRPALAARCECPHFARGEWCKHVWATLRALEELGWEPPRLGLDAAKRTALVRLDEAADDDDDDASEDWLASDDDEIDPEPVQRIPRARVKPPFAGRRSRSSSEWSTRVAALASEPQFEATGRSPSTAIGDAPLLYLIDAGEIRRLQSVSIAFARRGMRRDGSPGALTPVSIDLGETARAATEDERAAQLQLLTLAQVEAVLGRSAYGHGSYATDPRHVRASRVAVPTAFLDPILPRLAASGRLALVPEGARVFGDAGAVEPIRLRFDAGAPYEWRLRVEPHAEGGFALRGRFVRGAEELDVDAAQLVLAAGFVVTADALARADVAGATRAVAELRRAPLRVPARDLDAFVARLAETPGLAPPELAPELGWTIRSASPSCRLRFDEIESRRLVEAELHFGYGAAWIEANAQQRRIADTATRTLFERDPESERAAVEVLRALGFASARRAYEGEAAKLAVPSTAFESAASELLAKGWILEVAGSTLRSPGRSRAQVRSGVDFFDLEGAVEYGSEAAPFPALLEAIARGSRFVRLSDGSRGLVPRAWLERSAGLAGIAEAHHHALRFGRAQIGFLAELVDAQDAARGDRRFGELRRKIARFDGIAPADAPAGFRGTLRPYQRDGLGWLGFLAEFGLGGCLADDMGLGKTVQVLALLAGRKRARGKPRVSLVVAPKSVVGGWIEEAARFAPKLRVLRYEGGDRAALRADLARHDLVVTTYGTLLRDVEHLAEQRFDYAILDESQAIKNAASRTARAVKLLRAEHRLTLTGTPVENHLGELASQLEFLNPGLLGHARSFDVLTRGRVDASSLALLQRALRPLLLRRTKEQVLSDLPPKTEQTLLCDLEGKQRRDYDELRRHYQASLIQRVDRDGIERSKIYVLEALLRLRQAACHPALIDAGRSGESSAKLALLYERLDEVAAEGHKALVFSQFTSLLAEVRLGLDARGIDYAYLDGRTRDRRERIARFESDPACKLFLISLKAGGTGLNLTAADYVFLLDPWWNPAVEAQAIDRTHRIGQTRPVFAYRIVARDTVEEKILELQDRKRGLARSIFGDDQGLVAGLDAEDLRELIG